MSRDQLTAADLRKLAQGNAITPLHLQDREAWDRLAVDLKEEWNATLVDDELLTGEPMVFPVDIYVLLQDGTFYQKVVR